MAHHKPSPHSMLPWLAVLVVIVPVVVDIAAPHSLDAALGGSVTDRTRTYVNRDWG